MANPQREDGHTDIANEIVEALARCHPGHGEGQVLWVILRKTYGWHKKEDQISIEQIQNLTGLSRRMVIYCLQNLEAKQMITIKRKRGRGIKNEINIISFQKNYDKWVVQEKSRQYKNTLEKRKLVYKKSKELVVQEGISSARNGNLVVQEMEKDIQFLAPTKETITKENIQKKTFTPDFLSFYSNYPKKVGRKEAYKWWQKTKPNLEIVLNALKIQKEYKEKLIREGKFCPEWPDPERWIKNRRWEDEIPQPQQIKNEPPPEDPELKKMFKEALKEGWKI